MRVQKSVKDMYLGIYVYILSLAIHIINLISKTVITTYAYVQQTYFQLFHMLCNNPSLWFCIINLSRDK